MSATSKEILEIIHGETAENFIMRLRQKWGNFNCRHISIRNFASAHLSDAQFKMLQQNALLQNSQALLALGYCHWNGIKTPMNKEEGFNCYKAAVEQGSIEAQINLGWCYRHGLGADYNEKAAFDCFRTAAEQGLTMAQTQLGFCYKEGIGTYKNEDEELKCYEAAAAQGDTTAKKLASSLKTKRFERQQAMLVKQMEEHSYKRESTVLNVTVEADITAENQTKSTATNSNSNTTFNHKRCR